MTALRMRARDFLNEDQLIAVRERVTWKGIALIAHDNKKRDMLEWAEYNLDLLAGHELFATATTGHLLQQQLGLPVTCFRSGPYGGDQQIGARILDGIVDQVADRAPHQIGLDIDRQPRRGGHVDREPEFAILFDQHVHQRGLPRAGRSDDG